MLDRHSNYNKALLKLSQSPVIEAGDYHEAAALIAQSATLGLNISRTSIWRFDTGFHEMICVCLFDNGEFQSEFTGYRLSEADFPKYFKALSEQRTIVANDARNHQDTSEFTETYLKPLDIYSMLDAPIRKQGKTIGIICCEQAGQLKEWTIEDESFVGALTDIAGRALVAVDHKLAKEELKKLNTQLEKRIADRTRNLEETISTLRETQKQLVESEKMASLGSLVAGVAHEVNTPLGVSLTSSSLLNEKLRDLNTLFTEQKLTQSALTNFMDESNLICNILENNLQKAANLIANFKQLAVDQSSDQIFEFNIKESLNSSLISLNHHLKKHDVQTRLKCDSALKIHTHAGAFSQIITNLILNAAIHAFDEHTQQPRIEIQVQTLANDELKIHFSDNGKGMTEEIVEKAFEPFFTTKRGQGGSGLGLHLVYNLVTQKLKGNIEVNSHIGQGSDFIIQMPKQISTP